MRVQEQGLAEQAPGERLRAYCFVPLCKRAACRVRSARRHRQVRRCRGGIRRCSDGCRRRAPAGARRFEAGRSISGARPRRQSPRMGDDRERLVRSREIIGIAVRLRKLPRLMGELLGAIEITARPGLVRAQANEARALGRIGCDASAARRCSSARTASCWASNAPAVCGAAARPSRGGVGIVDRALKRRDRTGRVAREVTRSSPTRSQSSEVSSGSAACLARTSSYSRCASAPGSTPSSLCNSSRRCSYSRSASPRRPASA